MAERRRDERESWVIRLVYGRDNVDAPDPAPFVSDLWLPYSRR